MKPFLQLPQLSIFSSILPQNTPTNPDEKDTPDPESITSSTENNQIQSEPIEYQTAVTIFISTFFTIFLAELGDKTQVTTLLLSAQSHSPWVVFIGAGIALVTTSLLGVLLGQWLASRISPKTIERISGIMLLIISVTLLWEIII